MNLYRHLLCFLLICDVSRSQNYDYDQGGDYGDYQQQEPDSLYADYVDRQADKAGGGNGGGGWGKTLAVGAGAWFLGGKVHSKRAVTKAKKIHAKEQKDLYLQYYKDVMALQQHNAQLEQYIDQVSKGQLNEEFNAADADRDNKVSRAEFNLYKKNYLQLHPEKASEFPRFEDFDPDSNGQIDKAEYDAYYARLMSQQGW